MTHPDGTAFIRGLNSLFTWCTAGQDSLPLNTRSFLDYCVPRLCAALADLLPADAAVLTGDLSSS